MNMTFILLVYYVTFIPLKLIQQGLKMMPMRNQCIFKKAPSILNSLHSDLKKWHSVGNNKINGVLVGLFLYYLTEEGKKFIENIKAGRNIIN